MLRPEQRSQVAATRRAVSAAGEQGWLASVRAELLPALPACCASGGGGRHVDGPHRLPLRRPAEREVSARVGHSRISISWASRSRSRYGSPLTSTATRLIVPPVNVWGRSPG